MRASTCGCSTSRSSAGAPSTPSSIRSAASSVPRDAPLGTVLRWVVDRGLRWASGAIGRAERHHPGAALSPGADAGLEMYLAGPVAHELRRAFKTSLPDTTFVFGHTHKPFVGTRGIAGYARPIAVVNTGGWVVDHPEAEPLKGERRRRRRGQRGLSSALPPAVRRCCRPAGRRPSRRALDRLRRAGPQRHRCARDPWGRFTTDVVAPSPIGAASCSTEVAVRRRLRRRRTKRLRT